MQTKTKKGLDATVLTLSVIGSLIFLNILGLSMFGRLDLTRDKQFTLSDATIDMLRALKEPVTIRAYFSQDLPPPYATNARYVKDLLEEYYNHARGNVRFEFVDPIAEETDADKDKKKEVKQDIFGRQIREETSVEKELRTVGVPSVQVRVNEGDKLEVKRAYMGIALNYGDKREVIPVVQNTDDLEYDLTTLIRKVSREAPPRVALLTGHDEPDIREEMSKVHGVLGQLYNVTPLDLSQEAKIPDDVSALLVIRPKKALSEAEKRAIDAYIMSGRSAAFLLDSVTVDIKTLETTDTQHGLNDLLATYGVSIEPGMVLDVESATIQIQRQQGYMTFRQPVQYPFMLAPRVLNTDHPLTRGLSQVTFPFMNPLSVNLPSDSGDAIKSDVLVRTSSKSWVQTPPYNLDPMQDWTPTIDPGEQGKPVVVALSGALKSHYQSDPAAQAASPDPSAVGSSVANNARVLVAGGGSFALDQFSSPSNEALLLNLMDWLVLDEALLSVRSRGLAAAPLDQLSETGRKGVKYANVGLLPLAFAGLGVGRWLLRERRRKNITL